MLFAKKIDPRCAYCQKGAQLGDDSVICGKKGIVSAANHCHAFKYDPLKRTPPKPIAPDFSRLKDEDFSL